MKKLLVLLAMVLVTGCVTPVHTAQTAPMRAPFEMSDVDAMSPGITTRDEATTKLGKPLSIVNDANGETQVTWAWGGDGHIRSARILFDKDGKMVRLVRRVES